ncbi:MAG: shikimate kinase [Chloroflexota bacterium]
MTSPARSTRIVLMGMMGAGKTTVGRVLAERLGCPYLDNDEAVRGMTGREPAEIRATDGEERLHDLESEALGWALAGTPPMVVGAAGYIADDPRAPAMLADDVTAVWLRARPETLRARIGSGAGRRAEATDLAWITRRVTEREPAYRGLADLAIDVDDLTADQVADRILDWLVAQPGA